MLSKHWWAVWGAKKKGEINRQFLNEWSEFNKTSQFISVGHINILSSYLRVHFDSFSRNGQAIPMRFKVKGLKYSTKNMPFLTHPKIPICQKKLRKRGNLSSPIMTSQS